MICRSGEAYRPISLAESTSSLLACGRAGPTGPLGTASSAASTHALSAPSISLPRPGAPSGPEGQPALEQARATSAGSRSSYVRPTPSFLGISGTSAGVARARQSAGASTTKERVTLGWTSQTEPHALTRQPTVRTLAPGADTARRARMGLSRAAGALPTDGAGVGEAASAVRSASSSALSCLALSKSSRAAAVRIATSSAAIRAVRGDAAATDAGAAAGAPATASWAEAAKELAARS
jgi:hypothetical protein